MIRTVVDDGVDVVLIDRPAARNACTVAMWRELAGAVRRLDRAAGNAPIVVRGAAGYFCSGADLSALAEARTGATAAAEFADAVVTALLALHTARRPTVALVDTGAAGGGVEIMLACHARTATGPVSLVFPFGRHGVRPDAFTAWRLAMVAGEERAAELTNGMHRLDGGAAVDAGLVDAVVTGPAGAATVPVPATTRWPVLTEGGEAARQHAAAPLVASLLAG